MGESPVRRTSPLVLAVALTILAAATRIYHLGQPSFWLDEASTIGDVSHPWGAIHRTVTGSPPLFFYLVKLVYSVVGRNDFWLRALPAFFGILTIPLFFHVLRKHLAEPAAFVGALFLCLSPIHIAYSQELRMYSLAAMEALLATHFFIKAQATGSRRAWWGCAAWMIAGLYTHYWFLFLVAGFGIVFAGSCYAKGRSDRNGWEAFLITGLALAPWIPRALRQHQPAFDVLTAPAAGELLQTFYALAGLRVTVGDTTLQMPPLAMAVFALATVALLILGLWRTGQRRSYVLSFFVVGCGLPLLIAFLESQWFKPVFLASRYPVMLSAAFLAPMAGAMTVDRRPWRTVAWGLAALWLAGSACLLPVYYRGFYKGDWKQAGRIVRDRGRGGDAVWLGALGYDGIAADYYIPAEIPRLADLQGADDTHGRIFIPMYRRAGRPEALSLGPRLSARWRVARIDSFREISVVELDRR
ncbi:MAG TPA: glycosyltransferase family 39 protein [Elusimicrobiota bacterium]|nr:glycosyltransferase family 39 protein [Elusimicrobiota bacterium]